MATAAMLAAVLIAVTGFAKAADSGKPMSRGEYLALMGDCSSCHIEGPAGQPYVGGLALGSPFGTIYATNITPDRETGIGNYTLEDFSRALREGIAKDGHYLYPAMPYPSFAAMSDEDVRDMYDYFMKEVSPAHIQPTVTKLPFPFNQRWALAFWNALFLRSGHFQPHKDRDDKWNRGAYLVQTLAHCGACHTPRGLAYEEEGYSESSPFYMTGAFEDNWASPQLTGSPASGLGNWSESDIAQFLKTGHAHGAVAFANMAVAIEKSTQFMTDDDRAAIAHYIKSLRPRGETASYDPEARMPEDMPHERPGAGVYMTYCSQCHGADGAGRLPRYPQLGGNAVALSKDPSSLIRLVLQGGAAPRTQSFINPGAMPAFENKLSDQDIADVLSYIRNDWGNKADPVTPQDVASMRAALKKQ